MGAESLRMAERSFRYSFSHAPEEGDDVPQLSYAAWEAEARHLLRLPPSASTAAGLRRVIRAAGIGSGRGAAPFGAMSGVLMPQLLEHYDRARQAAVQELRRTAEQHLQRQLQADEAKAAEEVAAWDRAYRAAVRSNDITQMRSVWRASGPFKFAVSDQRARLRQAALDLGYPIDPKLFGASAMSIAAREIQQARENSEMTPSAVPRFMETVLTRMVQLRAAEAQGVFRVPGDAALLTDMGERFESGDLVDASDPRCAHVSVYDWANLLTRWMRQLAEPLVPNDHRYDAAVELGRDQLQDGWGEISEAHAQRAQTLLDSLPVAHKAIVLRLVRFLRHLDAARTGMSFAALAVVFAPSLMRHPELKTAVANAHAEAALVQLLLAALPEMQPEHVPSSEEELDEEIDELGDADSLTMFAKTHSSQAPAQITALDSPRDSSSRNRLRVTSYTSLVTDPDQADEWKSWPDPLMPSLSVDSTPTPGSQIERDRTTTVGSSVWYDGLDDLNEEPVDRSPAWSDEEPEVVRTNRGWVEHGRTSTVSSISLDGLDDLCKEPMDSVGDAVPARRARLATAELSALREEEAYLLEELAKLDSKAPEKMDSARDAVSARRARLATADVNLLLQRPRDQLSTRDIDALRAEEQWLVEKIAKLEQREQGSDGSAQLLHGASLIAASCTVPVARETGPAPGAKMRNAASAASAARMATILTELAVQQERRKNAEVDQSMAEAELQHITAEVDAAIDLVRVEAPAAASQIKVGWPGGVSIATVRASTPPARPTRRTARIPGGGARVPSAAFRNAGPQPSVAVRAEGSPTRASRVRATTFNFVRAMELQKLLDPVRGEHALASRKDLRRGKRKAAPPTRRRARGS